MAFRSWGTADVVRQLKFLGFGAYSSQFQVNEICGLHLPLLTEDHLRELGVASVGHRILMLRRFADIASNKPISPMDLDTREPVNLNTINPPIKPIQQQPAKPAPAASPMRQKPIEMRSPLTPDSRTLTPRKSSRDGESVRAEAAPKSCLDGGWRVIGRSDQSDSKSIAVSENQDLGNRAKCQSSLKKPAPDSASCRMRVCSRHTPTKIAKK